MTAYTPPPTAAQHHAAYGRVQDELTRARARKQAEEYLDRTGEDISTETEQS